MAQAASVRVPVSTFICAFHLRAGAFLFASRRTVAVPSVMAVDQV
jgi:hypothetical protein